MASYRGLDACTHCGFCLPACPTWLESGEEGDSPRGRILLIRALEEGELQVDDPALVEHLGRCTLCRACEPVCPSGVAFAAGYLAAQSTLLAAGIIVHPAGSDPQDHES